MQPRNEGKRAKQTYRQFIQFHEEQACMREPHDCDRFKVGRGTSNWSSLQFMIPCPFSVWMAAAGLYANSRKQQKALGYKQQQQQMRFSTGSFVMNQGLPQQRSKLPTTLWSDATIPVVRAAAVGNGVGKWVGIRRRLL